MPIKNKQFKIGAAGTLIVLSAVFVSAGLAYGKDGSDDTNESTTTTQVETSDDTTQVHTETHSTQKSTDHAAKLSDVKKKVCEQRTAHIKSKMSTIVQHGTKQLGVFDKIAERTKAFAENKDQKPANYDALVADVTAKRQAAVDGLAALKDSQSSFSCDGDAHGVADTFKAGLKSEISLLKDYRTAIRNLIVGVKSAKSDTTDDNKTKTETE